MSMAMLLCCGILPGAKAQTAVARGHSKSKSGMVCYDFRQATEKSDKIYKHTICPDDAGCIRIQFNWLGGESDSAKVLVFEGESEKGKCLHTFGKIKGNEMFTAQNSCITLVFVKDRQSRNAVWTSSWSAVDGMDCMRNPNNVCAFSQYACGPVFRENYKSLPKPSSTATERPEEATEPSAQQSEYYGFRIRKDGLLNFDLFPAIASEDLDWQLYKMLPGWEDKCPGNTATSVLVAENRSMFLGPEGCTGMGRWGENLQESTTGNPFSKSMEAKAGEAYWLRILPGGNGLSGFELRLGDVVEQCENPAKDWVELAAEPGSVAAHIDNRQVFSQYSKILRIDLDEKANQPLANAKCSSKTWSEGMKEGKVLAWQNHESIGLPQVLLQGLMAGRIHAYAADNPQQALQFGDVLMAAMRMRSSDSTEMHLWPQNSADLAGFDQVVELIQDEIFDKNTGRKRKEIRYIRLLYTDRDGAMPDYNVALFKYEEVAPFLDQVMVENRHNDAQQLSLRDCIEGNLYQSVPVWRRNKYMQTLPQAKFDGEQQIECENYLWGN